LVYRGKVRDVYALENDLRLVVATDAVSIFDFVLNALVPLKGVILNAMNHFWTMYLREFGIPTDLVAAGQDIDQYLPGDLRNRIDLIQSRSIVVRRMDMAPVEFVWRQILTGSGWDQYTTNKGRVYGHQLPPGLQNGDAVPLLFTPTSKAQEGHDEPLVPEQVLGMYPELVYRSMRAFLIGSDRALQSGILLADAKFEGSREGLGDEMLTPDASRYVLWRAWEESRKPESGRKMPPALDKQIVRVWGETQGIKGLNPEDPGHVARVQSIAVPQALLDQVTQTYRYIFWRLTGMTIEQYLREEMAVEMARRVPKIAVVCGSKNDWHLVEGVVKDVDKSQAQIVVHVLSCHRNPQAVWEFAQSGGEGADVILGVGGKALALPGMISSFAHANGKDVPVVGVALGDPGSEGLLAAQLSITEVPGSPVVVDERTGNAYTGAEGLETALHRIIDGELPPLPQWSEKPPEFGIFSNY